MHGQFWEKVGLVFGENEELLDKYWNGKHTDVRD